MWWISSSSHNDLYAPILAHCIFCLRQWIIFLFSMLLYLRVYFPVDGTSIHPIRIQFYVNYAYSSCIRRSVWFNGLLCSLVLIAGFALVIPLDIVVWVTYVSREYWFFSLLSSLSWHMLIRWSGGRWIILTDNSTATSSILNMKSLFKSFSSSPLVSCRRSSWLSSVF